MYGKKKYLNTIFIALCFALWQLYVTIPIGIVLLIMQMLENKKLFERYGTIDQAEKTITSYENMIEDLKAKTLNLQNALEKETKNYEDTKKQYSTELENKKQEYLSEMEKLEKDIEEVIISQETKEIAESVDYSSYDSISSEECKNELALLKQEEKELIQNEDAIIVSQTTAAKKVISNNIKQIIRCFNAECDNIILSVTVKNLDSLRTKITKSFDTLNKIFDVDGVKLTSDMLEIKLKELTLLYNYEKKREEEKEIQREIKAQMVEEEKVRRELEKKRQQIEKDEKQFSSEVSKMMKYLQNTESEIEKKLYADKIAELEAKLKELQAEKDDVINRQENAKAGFVYIISNIGSFGEDVFKIGMTRRLEPLDRIKELSSASVPFEFDVHAMIFSENAPDLEAKLHNYFDAYRVNKVNPRKEFFKISIDDIETYIDENYDETVEFTKVPVARDYRESLAMA